MAATGTGLAGLVMSIIWTPSSSTLATTAYVLPDICIVSMLWAPSSSVKPSTPSVMAATGMGTMGSSGAAAVTPEAINAIKFSNMRRSGSFHPVIMWRPAPIAIPPLHSGLPLTTITGISCTGLYTPCSYDWPDTVASVLMFCSSTISSMYASQHQSVSSDIVLGLFHTGCCSLPSAGRTMPC